MKAHIALHPAHRTARSLALFTVSAMILLVAMAIAVPSASANTSSRSHEATMRTGGSDSGSRASLGGLEQRIKQLDELKKRLEDMMKNYKAGSSTRSQYGKPENRPGGMYGMGSSTRDRDDKWGSWSGKRPTTTPSQRPGCDERRGSSTASSTYGYCKPDRMQASSTPGIKVLHPNKGKVYRHGKDSGMIIMWTARGVSKVDIDLVGSTTISVAKGVAANNLYRKSISGHSGANDPTSEVKNRTNFGRYLYKNAPEGQGYKIVITGTKVGGGTVKDESDGTFSIVKAKTKKDWFNAHRDGARGAAHDADDHEHEDEDEHEDDGDVLGASTTGDAEFADILGELSTTLAGISEDLSS